LRRWRNNIYVQDVVFLSISNVAHGREVEDLSRATDAMFQGLSIDSYYHVVKTSIDTKRRK
jgi:hypothetical protein